MKSLFYNLCFALSVFSVTNSFAQNQNANVPTGILAQDNLDRLASSDFNATVSSFNLGYEGVKGSPFYPESWSEGKVKFQTSQENQYKKLKYDVIENQLWELNEKGQLKTFHKKYIDEFTLFDSLTKEPIRFKHFKHSMEVENNDDLEAGYYIVLHEDQTILFRHRDHIIKKADYTGAYNTGRKFDEIIQENDYYFKDEEGKFYRVRRNKKAVLKLLKRDEKKVASYIKQNNIQFKSDADLAKVFEYYDSLH